MMIGKTKRVLTEMHDRMHEQVCHQIANGFDPAWWMLRNRAALLEAIGIMARLQDYIARQRAEGNLKGMDADKWDAWCMEVLGDVFPPPAPVDVVEMMGNE